MAVYPEAQKRVPGAFHGPGCPLVCARHGDGVGGGEKGGLGSLLGTEGDGRAVASWLPAQPRGALPASPAPGTWGQREVERRPAGVCCTVRPRAPGGGRSGCRAVSSSRGLLVGSPGWARLVHTLLPALGSQGCSEEGPPALRPSCSTGWDRQALGAGAGSQVPTPCRGLSHSASPAAGAQPDRTAVPWAWEHRGERGQTELRSRRAVGLGLAWHSGNSNPGPSRGSVRSPASVDVRMQTPQAPPGRWGENPPFNKVPGTGTSGQSPAGVREAPQAWP